jgi:xanthine dehydrogenase accessory factor
MKAALLAELTAARTTKRPVALVTDIAVPDHVLVDQARTSGTLKLSEAELVDVRARIKADRSGMMTDGAGQRFVRVYAPPARMVIVGAVHIAQALAPMAHTAGFDVIVIDPREGFVRSSALTGIRAITAWPDEAMTEVKPDARTAVVTLTHDPKLDDPALAAALRSDAFYIGALGSRKTHAKRLERLADAGFTQEHTARIHGPVGLDINALTPAEIAVAILAQVIEQRRAGAE